ncbi:MAG: hypothetical protein ACQSGP_13960 [Frankia sp.]
MAADRLSVDLDGLERLASDLESIRSRMDATRSLLDSFDGDIGSAKVSGALASFEHNWRDGRKKIDNNAERLSKMADESAKGIRKADGDLANDLTQADAPPASAP